MALWPGMRGGVLDERWRPPAGVQTVGQGAARARVDRRTCERWFTRVGLPSPRHFLAAARVLYAHRLLQDPGFTIEDVAQRLGYAQAKTLQQHARSYLGLTAGEMRLSLSPQEALERLTRRFPKPHSSPQRIAAFPPDGRTAPNSRPKPSLTST